MLRHPLIRAVSTLGMVSSSAFGCTAAAVPEAGRMADWTPS